MRRASVLVAEESHNGIIRHHDFIKPTLCYIFPFTHLLVFVADSAQPHRTCSAVAPYPTFAAHVLQRVKYIHKTHTESLMAGAQSTYTFTVHMVLTSTELLRETKK